MRPQVEYAAAVWDPHTDREIKAIQAVQRRAARFCLGRYRRTSHVSDMLEELQWPTLKSRRKASRLTMLFKIVNGLVKISAQSLKAPLRRSRHHHSKTFQLVQSRTNYRKFSFFPRTVKDWNQLPEEVVSADSLDSFRVRLAAASS